MNHVLLDLLMEYKAVPYSIVPCSAWIYVRTLRDLREVQNWLIPLAGRELGREELDRAVDDEMLVRNFIKPRACLGFRKSAEVYFGTDAVLHAAEEVREWLAQGICEVKALLGSADPEEAYEIKKSGERLHRKAVRQTLQKLGLYEEWDTAAPKGPPEAEVVNRTGAANVSF